MMFGAGLPHAAMAKRSAEEKLEAGKPTKHAKTCNTMTPVNALNSPRKPVSRKTHRRVTTLN
jgi:hypothetical protein